MSTSPRIKTLMIAIILVIIAGVLYLILSPTKPTMALPSAVTIDTSNQPTEGNPQAKLTIVAFEDLKCSNCMRYNQTIFPNIENNYIKTGKANYTIINLAFIPGPMPHVAFICKITPLFLITSNTFMRINHLKIKIGQPFQHSCCLLLMSQASIQIN